MISGSAMTPLTLDSPDSPAAPLSFGPGNGFGSGAIDLSRRLPRVGDVPHDGGGSQAFPCRPSPAGQRILAVPRPPPKPRRLDWVLAARPDSALLLVPGRCGPALLARQPLGARPIAQADDPPRRVARAAAHPARRISAIHGPTPNLLDLRGHSQPDRLGLSRAVPARLPPRARAMGRAGARYSSVTGRPLRSTPCQGPTSTMAKSANRTPGHTS